VVAVVVLAVVVAVAVVVAEEVAAAGGAVVQVVVLLPGVNPAPILSSPAKPRRLLFRSRLVAFGPRRNVLLRSARRATCRPNPG